MFFVHFSSVVANSQAPRSLQMPKQTCRGKERCQDHTPSGRVKMGKFNKQNAVMVKTGLRRRLLCKQWTRVSSR